MGVPKVDARWRVESPSEDFLRLSGVPTIESMACPSVESLAG